MKVETRIFHVLTAFFGFITVVYGFMTYQKYGEVEWVGTPALALTFGMSAMIGFYFELTAKNIDDRPEDDPEGQIADLPGEQGFFAPHSWWPLPLAFGCAIIFLGLAVGWWVFYIGLAFTIFPLLGWVYEFYTGAHKH